jgi:serine/threonine protein kinase
MFVDPQPGADIKLIDFGSGTNKVMPNNENHTTFAGTPFYNSPEMFQKTYNTKTDFWSFGVTLYVLVAGYPSEKLQRAFNILQDSKRTSLKTLPNTTDLAMPDSFYNLLNDALNCRYKFRKSAKELLQYDFIQFHKDLLTDSTVDEEQKETTGVDDVVMPLTTNSRKFRMSRTQSIALIGSVRRHSILLDFQKYERSVTTLLASMLSKMELADLLGIWKEKIDDKFENDVLGNMQLQVVRIGELKKTPIDEMKNDQM